jgi:uncharacterized protein (TIGR03663 family)
MMHGPLLFHVNALLFSFLDINDASARTGQALVGTLVILLPLCFRSFLGNKGAWLCGLLLSISPTMTFYSRYARNDIYSAFLAMLWFCAVLRYLVTPRLRWMFLMTISMAFSFITKEVSFIHGFLMGIFLMFVMLIRFARPASREKVH